MTKDQEITKVTEKLDKLLVTLQDNVDALNKILTRPAPPAGDEDGERLVSRD